MRIILLLFTLAGVSRADVLFSEEFNHNGALPAGWTIESRAQAARTQDWAPYNQGSGDWAMRTQQVNFETPYDEWLISPLIDASQWQNLSLGLSHSYTHGNSQARLRVSTNGGGTWSTLSSWSASTSGSLNFNTSALMDGQAVVKLAFVFSGTFINSGASWMVDNIVLQGQGTTDQIPPLADMPVPMQPMEGAWGTLSGQVGCTFHDASGVDASTVQVRIDANNDGDYLDGGAESWNAVTGLQSGASVEVLATVAYMGDGLDQAFEFRALDLSSNGQWAYSGGQHLEGMADDWGVNIFNDTMAPVFSNATPSPPQWLNNLHQSFSLTLSDDLGTVDASSLALRVDWNHDGMYSGTAEDWQPLTGYENAASLVLNHTLDLPEDGRYAVEVKASDILGNGPAYSMGMEGPQDDLVLQADTMPPTASVLYPMGSTATSATLAFSPTTDATFAYYEMFLDTTETVDELDTRIGPEQLPELAQQGTYQITLNQLAFGRRHWFRLRAVDLLGHVGHWSNTVSVLLEGIAPAAITDVHIQLVEGGIQLSWTPPTTDVNGDTPLEIEGYKVWQLDAATGQLVEALATVTTPFAFLPFSFAASQSQVFAVTVLGSGTTPPPAYPGAMILVPAGTFQMGQEGLATPVHQVTLTQDFYLSQTEVTQSQYRAAALWAIEQGLVQLDGSSLSAHGQYLSDLPAESNYPMIYITWYGAACYSDWLSLMEGKTPYYNGNWEASAAHNPYAHDGYRLPTEAEWEYAARYSDGRTYPWGNTPPTPCLHANYEWCAGGPSPVGSYPAGNSALGLQDMAGNVWEWVNDWYGGYPSSPVTDPYGIESIENWDSYRVLRGGSLYDVSYYLQSASRYYGGPYDALYGIGFRLLRTP